MVIRECLVYNLDLFKFKAGNWTKKGKLLVQQEKSLKLTCENLNFLYISVKALEPMLRQSQKLLEHRVNNVSKKLSFPWNIVKIVVAIVTLRKILKWKKIYGLNVYLFLILFFSLTHLFTLSRRLPLVQTLRKEINFLRLQQKCTPWAICHIKELLPFPHKGLFICSVAWDLLQAAFKWNGVWENLLFWI
jgi:hypothetical protein